MAKNSENGTEKALIENDHVYIVNNPKTTNVYSVYLNEEIGDPKNYRDVFNLLRESGEDDHIILYLNNYGGYVHTGIDIVNSIRASHGKVYTCMTGPCYSMAPLIVLAGDKVFVEQDVFMMFHDYSGASRGKGHEMTAQILHEKPHFDAMFERLAKGFLTKNEIKDINNGQDLYLDRDQILKRLKKIKKLGNKLEVK